jgi:LmbE family N-acetylglucosaminyl deacetylase
MAGQQGGTHVWSYERCAVIVAHPDDETLWASGTIMLHPESKWTIVTLCRRNDLERAAKFFLAIKRLGATGAMGDLDDGPEQRPLAGRDVQRTILELLATNRFDLILTHAIWGEYTRHLRHEETAKAVIALRDSSDLVCREVRMFAYEDGGGKYLPRAVGDADVTVRLPEDIWQKKYEIITQTYGFAADSFEAKTTPKQEAFWVLRPGHKSKRERTTEV